MEEVYNFLVARVEALERKVKDLEKEIKDYELENIKLNIKLQQNGNK